MERELKIVELDFYVQFQFLLAGKTPGKRKYFTVNLE
jgi:hypothetical protein